MNIDNRTFKYAGSSADPNGVYKARFANDPEARPAVMTKAGHTNFVLVALPKPMTKLEAIAYLKETKPEGVNLASLDEKEAYINKQLAKLNGTAVPAKRGRPAKKTVVESASSSNESSNVVETPASESIVKTIVNTARGGSIRAKAAAQAAKVVAARK